MVLRIIRQQLPRSHWAVMGSGVSSLKMGTIVRTQNAEFCGFRETIWCKDQKVAVSTMCPPDLPSCDSSSGGEHSTCDPASEPYIQILWHWQTGPLVSRQSPHEQRAALPRDPRESSCSSVRQWYERLAAHHPGEHNHRGRHPDLGLPVSKPLETKQWWLITARWDMMMSQQPRIKTVLALDSRWCWHQIITPGVRGQPGLTLRECHPFSCKRLDTWLQLGQNP